MTDAPALEVVLLTHNCADLTAQALCSIAEHEPETHLIWVDNGSTLEEREHVVNVLRDLPDLHWTTRWQAVNTGYPTGMNIGLAAATAAHVIIANNDIVLHNAAFTTMHRVAMAEGYDILNPLSTNRSRPDYLTDLPPEFAAEEIIAAPDHAARGALLARLYPEEHYALPMLSFFCTLLSRRALDTIGWLDQGYGLGWGEDDQYCERALAAGLRLGVAPGAFVDHVHRGTWSRIMSRAEQRERWQHAQNYTAAWRQAGSPQVVARLPNGRTQWVIR